MALQSIRYFKSGLFETSLFIAGKDEPVYKQLIGYHQKIEAMDLGTRSPIFHNIEKEYATISFKGVKQPLEQQKKYNIEVIFKEVKKENKCYINAYVGSCVLSAVQNEVESKIISLD